MKKNLIITLTMLLFVSCKSTTFFDGRADIYGIIYDKQMNSVSGYELLFVSEDGSEILKTISDVNGKFVLKNILAREYKVSGKKKNYEKYSDNIAINDRKQFLVINTYSIEDLYKEIDGYMNQNDFENAKQIVARLEKISNNDLVKMYSAIVEYHLDNYDGCNSIIKSVKKKSSNYKYFQKLSEIISS